MNACPPFRQRFGTVLGRALAALALAGLATPALGSQSTISLRASDTTLRGGSYKDRSYGTVPLVTRASGNDTYVRRALLKFDTSTTIPKGTTINEATLTLTVRRGNSESRTITAFAEPRPFRDREANWIRRKVGYRWNTPGGDTAGRYASAQVAGTPGSKVSFGLTRLVQDVVNGKWGSRYTRVLLVDEGPSSRASWKEYYSDEASTKSVRPKLTVTFGGTTTTANTSDSGGTTLRLRGRHTRDTTLRGGTYKETNFGTRPLVTRASSRSKYERRALLKFDTSNTIPKGANIDSATLVLTVRRGNSEKRTVTAFAEPKPFREGEATWIRRKSSYRWSTPGGDKAGRYAKTTVTATSGSKVKFDLTRLVQDVVNGKWGSRYTRVLLIDEGGSSRGSWKEYYSREAGDSSVRPKLVVTYGGSSTTTTTSSTSSSSGSTSTSTLRVLHWNIHHGVGTDGKYDLVRIAKWISKANPDLVSLNEVERYTSWGNEDQPARFASLLQNLTGRRWYYKFAQKNGNAKGIGNLILSRFPLDSKSTFLLSRSKSVARVTVTVSGRTVNMFSTHLDAKSSSYRLTQIKELKGYAANFAEQRIIAGDFNAGPRSTETAKMTNHYYDAWAKAKSDGTAVAYSDNPDGKTRRGRIDYIFFSRDARALKLKKARVFDTRNSSGHKPSDHRPILAVYEVR